MWGAASGAVLGLAYALCAALGPACHNQQWDWARGLHVAPVAGCVAAQDASRNVRALVERCAPIVAALERDPSPSAATSPYAPLGVEEITAAVAAIRSDTHCPADVRFQTVVLREPEKSAAQAPGAAQRRKALLVALDHDTGVVPLARRAHVRPIKFARRSTRLVIARRSIVEIRCQARSSTLARSPVRRRNVPGTVLRVLRRRVHRAPARCLRPPPTPRRRRG